MLGEVHALAQSSDGAVWIGGYGGVLRWDGTRVRQADGGRIRREVEDLIITRDDRVYALTRDDGTLFEVDGPRTRALQGPDGSPLGVSAAAIDAAGRLVFVHDGQLLRLRDGHLEFLREHAVLRGVWRILVLSDGDVLVGQARRLWRLPAVQGPPRLLTRMPDPVYTLAEAPDGSVFVGDFHHNLVHLAPDGRELDRRDSGVSRVQGIDFGSDGSTWIGGNRGVLHFRPDGTDEIIGSQTHGVQVGGDLLVDQEGSLWVGSFDGVHQISSPAVRTWTEADGLVSDLTRFVHATDEHVYITTWNTPQRMEVATGRATVLRAATGAKGQICEDGTGIVWTGMARDPTRGVPAELLGLRGDDIVYRVPTGQQVSYVHACDTDDQGSVWITAHDRLWELRGSEIRESHALHGSPRHGKAVMIHGDEVYVSVANEVCVARITALRAQEARWRCSSIPHPVWIRRLVRSDAGRLWAASKRGLFVQHADDEWRLPPASLRRPSSILNTLAPASEGGMWLGGHGTLLRIRDTPDHSDEYEVIQDLTAWVGPQVATIFDLTEDRHGTLWIGHSAGVTAVAREQQHPDLAPPPVSIRGLHVDGVEVAVEGVPLPSPDSVLRIRASAPSYRAPSLLRYRSRIRGRPWSEPVEDGIFGLQGLPAGRHVFEVSASLDGVAWTEPPASLTVAVPISWYARIELWMGALLLLSLGALTLQRIRAGVALRLERLRTRIALDLHDEIGAGLGAIGLLGSVLRRDLPQPAVRAVGDDIVEASTELSQSLRAIVWSLQPSSQTVQELAAWLTDRARLTLADLHAHGRLELHIDPESEGARLDLDVLRAAQLVGLEALQNIAKHARASRAALRVERAGRRWRLTIEDDGVGIDPDRQRPLDGGLGLAGMARRADEIGGELRVTSSPGSGTRITLWLPRPRRLLR